MFYQDPWFYTTMLAFGGFVYATSVACRGYLKHWHQRALDVATMRKALDTHRQKVTAATGSAAPVQVETPIGRFHWVPKFTGKVGKQS